jgi:hypothetical protein
MIEATLSTHTMMNTIPQYITVEYVESNGVPAHSTSTELIGLNLLAASVQDCDKHLPPIDLTGNAYSIDLNGINIACESTNYDMRIFTIDDFDADNTIYEVIYYTEIVGSTSDTFDKFIIKNRDNPNLSYLYLKIDNNSDIATGPISISLTYAALDTRPDTEE